MRTIWLASGLLLCAAELLAPGVYLLWVGLAGLGVGLVLLVVGLSPGLQVGLFVVFAAVSVVAGQAWQRRARDASDDPNAASAGLVGQRCRAVSFDGAEGRVRFRDGEWPARVATAADLDPIPPGESLMIVGVEGTRLAVRRLARNEG